MSQIIKKFIGDDQVGANKILLENNSALQARNAANSANVALLKLDASDAIRVQGNFLPSAPSTGKLGNDNDAFTELHVEQIKDGTGGAVIETITRIFYDTGGNNSVDADQRFLIDTGSNTVIDYSDPAFVLFNGRGFIGTNPDQQSSWGSNLPGLVIDGTSGEGAAASGGGLFFKGNNTQSLAIMTTDQTGATGSATLFVSTGNTDTGNTGTIDFYTGSPQGASGNSGSYFVWTGNAPGDSGNLSLNIGNAGGTQGYFQFRKNGVSNSIGDIWTATSTDGKGYWAAPSSSITPAVESFTLIAGDITNGYVTVANTPIAASVMMFVSGLKSKYTTDYTVSGAQVNFSTHTPTLAIGDVVEIHYAY